MGMPARQYNWAMPNRSSNNQSRTGASPDLSQLAASIVEAATEPPEEEASHRVSEKDPLAVELGRRGGRKGGPARAQRLTAARRSEIAKKAAAARWGSGHKQG